MVDAFSLTSIFAVDPVSPLPLLAASVDRRPSANVDLTDILIPSAALAILPQK